jgi:REP element-mobilizing transposase RayT
VHRFPPTTIHVAGIGREVVQQLLSSAGKLEFSVLAYCVMPDHIHALVESRSDTADFQTFVKHFKQVNGFAFRKQTSQFLWQPGYHEHILRNDQTTETVIRYVLESPLRAGLATVLGEYPFAGSGEYTLEELRAAWETQA